MTMIDNSFEFTTSEKSDGVSCVNFALLKSSYVICHVKFTTNIFFHGHAKKNSNISIGWKNFLIKATHITNSFNTAFTVCIVSSL